MFPAPPKQVVSGDGFFLDPGIWYWTSSVADHGSKAWAFDLSKGTFGQNARPQSDHIEYNLEVLCVINQASPFICSKEQECNDLIDAARLQIHSLRTKAGENRVSASGATFTGVDLSTYPAPIIEALGQAYRDPSRLIWGDVFRSFEFGGDYSFIGFKAANEFCKTRGARLPSKSEFMGLATYLESSGKYSSLIPNSKISVLPFLQNVGNNKFWSSDEFEMEIAGKKLKLTSAFDGGTGQIITHDTEADENFAVCVVGD